MKKIMILVFAIVGLVLFSCEKENVKTNEDITYKVEKFSFNNPNSKGSEIEMVEIEFAFNTNSEEVVAIKASENLLDYLNMTDDELESYVFEQMRTEAQGNESSHDHSSCIQGCIENYTNEDGTKKPGRGACKFNCWVSTAVQIIQAIAPVLAVL